MATFWFKRVFRLETVNTQAKGGWYRFKAFIEWFLRSLSNIWVIIWVIIWAYCYLWKIYQSSQKLNKAQSPNIICHQLCSHFRHMAINQVEHICATPHSFYVWTKADNPLECFVWTPPRIRWDHSSFIWRSSLFKRFIVHSGVEIDS